MELNELLNELVEKVEPITDAIQFSGVIEAAMPQSITVIVLNGGVDQYEWKTSTFSVEENDFPLHMEDIETYRLVEAALIENMLLIRRGFRETGYTVAPTHPGVMIDPRYL